MKTIILILIINLSIYGQGQKIDTTTTSGTLQINSDWFSIKPLSTSSILNIQNFEPTLLTISFGDNNKYLSFEVKGDSLITSGDLKPDLAAKIFIRFTQFFYTKRFDSLRSEVAKYKMKLDSITELNE